MGNCLARCMWWPASSGRLAVAQMWSGETHQPADQVHGEWVAVGEAQRNVGGSGEMAEGQEELVNPDTFHAWDETENLIYYSINILAVVYKISN